MTSSWNSPGESQFRASSIDSFHAEHTANFLYQSMQQHKFCDFTILCNDKAFDIHKAVLAANSPKFAYKLECNSNINSVTLLSVPEIVACAVIRYLYTGQVNELKRVNHDDLLLCCQQLLLEDVLDIVPERLYSTSSQSHSIYGSPYSLKTTRLDGSKTEENLELNNVIDLFLGIKKKGDCRQNLETIVTYIIDRLQVVSCTESFLNMPVEDLMLLLSELNQKKMNQMTLFLAVKKWLEIDTGARLKFAVHVLQVIDFQSLTHYQLTKVQKSNIMSIPSCHKLLNDSLRNPVSVKSEILLKLNSNEGNFSNAHASTSLCSVPKDVTPPAPPHRPCGSRRNSISSDSVASESLSLRDEQDYDFHNSRLFAICGIKMFELMDNGCDYEWILVTNMPYHKNYPAIAYLGGCIHVIGGKDSETEDATNNVMKYNVVTGEWEDGNNLLEARDYADAAVLNDAIYVVGGMGSHPIQKSKMLNSVEIYQTYGSQWKNAQRSSTCCIGSTFVSFENQLFRVGGYDGQSTIKYMEVYDPQRGKWWGKKPMTKSFAYAAGAISRGGLYVMGGAQLNGNHRVSLSGIHRYDGNIWTHVGNLSQSRCNAGVFVLNNLLYLLGGYHITKDQKYHALTSVECFNVDTLKFIESDIPNLPKGGATSCCVAPKNLLS